MSFAAVLSDLDGVLVDSGDSVERVWREWALARGLDPDFVVDAMHGVPSRQVIERVAPQLGPEEAARVDALHAREPVEALEGAADLLAFGAAVVTSCSGPLALARLEGAGLGLPRVLVTVDDVPRGKPDPDPYLEAARRLGVDPRACLVIEDAPAGIAAGNAAGCTVWAVATTHAPEALTAAAELLPDTAAVSARLSATGSPAR
jgi:mannitol-1-/sugar-/sorbitol-6-phosphatase